MEPQSRLFTLKLSRLLIAAYNSTSSTSIEATRIPEGGPMDKDRVKGTIDEAAGTVKQKTGQLTGDTALQIEGIAQQVKGKLENAWGKAKDAVHDANEESRTQNDKATHGGAGRKQ
jgi:uncharacterized protein YjbJ (UPF0337 family)